MPQMQTIADEGMDSLYAEPAKAQAPPKADNKAPVDEKAAEAPTALVPKSLFAGQTLKQGDEFIFKVVADHGEEIEIEYSKGGEGEGESAGSADREIEAMDRNNPRSY